ncbi:MAG: hypothetical protein ACK5SI_00325 [Planctomycetia bacterium]
MQSTTLTAALVFLRIVVGLHFFLEGLAHLRDADWSSAGFRKVAVGPFADWYRSALPQTGDWRGTLGAADARSTADVAKAWRESVVASWRRLLDERAKRLPLDAAAKGTADKSLVAAGVELDEWLEAIEPDLTAHRLEVARLAAMERKPGAAAIPFERERVTKKRAELAGQAAGWMKDADAIGAKLVAAWDAQLGSDADRRRAAVVDPAPLWKADRFVSWSLVTIGASLVLGVLVKVPALGGATFLASVLATQPFWVPGAQPTYNQWVDLAALLVIAALPVGGWSGLEYFLKQWCPLSRRSAGCCSTSTEVKR